MKSKTKLLFIFYFFLISFFMFEMVYLEKRGDSFNHHNLQKTKELALVSLPNLALAIEENENYLRHKSYANIFDILPNDGEVQTNSKMSFIY